MTLGHYRLKGEKEQNNKEYTASALFLGMEEIKRQSPGIITIACLFPCFVVSQSPGCCIAYSCRRLIISDLKREPYGFREFDFFV